jgi:hypothetical protein
MALAIPASIGLFSVLQDALKTSDGILVRLTYHTHSFKTSIGSWRIWAPVRLSLLKWFWVNSLQPKEHVMPQKRDWTTCTFCLSPMASFCPFYVVTPGQLQSPQNSSRPTARGAPSPTATWNWQPSLLNSMFWPRRLTSALTPFTICPTTRPSSLDRRNGPPPPRAPLPISSASMLSTNGIIVTSHSTTSFRGGQISFRSMFSSFSSHRFPTPCSFQLILPLDNSLAHVPAAKRYAFRTDISLVQKNI